MDVSNQNKLSKIELPIVQLIITILGVFITLFGVWMFNVHLLVKFSLPLRVILMLVIQWMLLIAPGILMIINKDSLYDIGFRKEKIPIQIGIGVILALLLSLIFTIIPILLGYKEMVGNIIYTKPWQFIIHFIYVIFGVAIVEEFIFRGYIFHKLLKIKNSRLFAIILSSIIFGLFHIFNGNIIQIFITAIIGFIFCLFREKIKSCTLISLIVAHGVYDFLIILWCAIL